MCHLTKRQQDALDDARQALNQERDSAAPMELRRMLLRAALTAVLEAFNEDGGAP